MNNEKDTSSTQGKKSINKLVIAFHRPKEPSSSLVFALI